MSADMAITRHQPDTIRHPLFTHHMRIMERHELCIRMLIITHHALHLAIVMVAVGIVIMVTAVEIIAGMVMAIEDTIEEVIDKRSLARYLVFNPDIESGFPAYKAWLAGEFAGDFP